MGYWINKVVWFLSNPLDVGIVLIAVGIWLTWHRSCSAFWARLGRWMARAGVIIILLLSLPITAHVLGYGLERNYEEHDPKDTPEGEVVLDLAGSWQRAWYAAELVKAKRAKWLITSGVGVDRLDAKLIRDLGVKEPALILDVDARNTEENVKNAKKVFAERCLPCDQSPATSHQSPTKGSGGDDGCTHAAEYAADAEVLARGPGHPRSDRVYGQAERFEGNLLGFVRAVTLCVRVQFGVLS